jgi:UDP-N-acetylmuramoyl-tripeptide--D-alanyl-D-alanine ligase
MLPEDLYKIFKECPVICTDSRNIIPGSIFFALKGENFDGNQYAKDVILKGAKYAVIDNSKFEQGSNFIVVDDTLLTLQKLANFHRKQLKIPIIAITGTNGKTTTKELFSAVFSKKFDVIATKGNLNNHIGVPITLLSMNHSTEIGIVEMGANHLNEISTLCNIAVPDFGLITNIGKAHLEGFGSFKGVIKAKTELYTYLDKSKGTIFYNAENSILSKAVSKLRCKKVGYGTTKSAFFSVGDITSDPFLSFSIMLKGKPDGNNVFHVNTNLIGSYNLENTLAAISAGLHFEISIDKIIAAIEEYVPTNYRSQYKKIGTNQFLLDFYNANPSSMEAALNNFKNISAKGLKKVLILGEMLELGAESENEHLKIIQLINSLGLNEVYLVGEGFFVEKPNNFNYFLNTEMLKEHLKNNKIENSFILIKGSRGVKLESILECF